MDQEINEFIRDNQVATICCVENGKPYCFSCFYVVMEKEGCIAFKSSFSTRHGSILEKNNNVAGAILPGEFDPSMIRGIQFEGTATEENEYSLYLAAAAYYSKYPVALAMPGKIWIVEFHSLKYTDNSKGFGYKNIWEKQLAYGHF